MITDAGISGCSAGNVRLLIDLARMIPNLKSEDLLLGMWDLLGQLGRVARRLIWGNETFPRLRLPVSSAACVGLPGTHRVIGR